MQEREKQIEEMAHVLCGYAHSCDECASDYRCEFLLECGVLHNAGYRKQSEGAWQIKSEIHQMLDDVDETLYVECPFCQRRFWVPYGFEDEEIFKYAREHYPYCNCGAKMKGGVE